MAGDFTLSGDIVGGFDCPLRAAIEVQKALDRHPGQPHSGRKRALSRAMRHATSRTSFFSGWRNPGMSAVSSKYGKSMARAVRGSNRKTVSGLLSAHDRNCRSWLLSVKGSSAETNSHWLLGTLVRAVRRRGLVLATDRHEATRRREEIRQRAQGGRCRVRPAKETSMIRARRILRRLPRAAFLPAMLSTTFLPQRASRGLCQ